ncbi:Mrp/NBP35 family ATP-binding protein [Pectinatus cerevisiiphilus]|uniref:Iron-sulfur cluster carrier protein n=1 Tax=Pectinatus cerevisiiphilus TaxID=86956 RepID=A0A4R3K1P6_9FIRM|nr:Mrp/NBP35 family ATP-binding protein [Pectinatus cerevisiiphilus]TCS75752.1 Mrp family chromosome partitioning ATPase [Pectinatus cerevisiiphilus]
MSDECSHACDGCSSSDCGQRAPKIPLEKGNPNSHIKKVIAVVSGKGGVGKTLVTSMLAVIMKRRGFNVGVLDADITGPSIPKAFGITGKADCNDKGTILPVTTKTGIKLMSVNLLLENDTDPVVWRGPVISGVVKQFWNEVEWGDIDYMFVDMPPGTGDIPLTVFQSLPVNGIVVVTSPQDLVSMIVEKAVKMAAMMNKPVLGIVENMAYFECPDCKKKHYIFGESNITSLAGFYNIHETAQIPLDPKLAAECDKDGIEAFSNDYLNLLAAYIEQNA